MADATQTGGDAASPAQGKRRFWRNTGFSLVQQLVSLALAVALLPFMLWRLGAEQYGLWLTLQIFNILGLAYLAELGFQGAIVRHLVRLHVEGDRDAFRHLLASGFALFLGIGLLTGGAVAWFAQTAFTRVFPVPPGQAEEMRLALTVYAGALVVGFPALMLKSFFNGLQNLALQKIWETLDRLLFSALVVAILLRSDRILYLVLAEQAIAIVLLFLFGLVARRRYGVWFTADLRQARWSSLRGVLGLSGAVFTTNVANQAFIRGPEALVGAMLGPVMLAHYQIATRLPRVLKALAGSLNAAVLPHMAGLDTARSDEAAARREFALAGLRVNYLLFTPAAVAMAVLSPFILTTWVGRSYAFLAPFLALFALWQLSAVAVNFSAATLTRVEHYRRLIRRNLAVAALFVLACVTLLPRYGLGAMFAALLASGLLTAAAALAAFRRAHGLSLRQLAADVAAGPVLGSALLGTALLLPAAWFLEREADWRGLTVLALASLLYALAWYRLVLRAPERRWLGAVLAKSLRKQ